MKWTALLVIASTAGCLLEDFEKQAELCGMPPSSSAECLACVAKSPCCALAKECAADGSCAADLAKPVTPASVFTPSYDRVLGCLQTQCDDACGISWGCADGYEFAAPSEPVASSLYVLDSALENGAGGLDVHGCDGTDPLCLRGTPLGTTDAEGAVVLSPVATYADSFRIAQPGSSEADPLAYVPTHTRWSEHVTWAGPASTYVFRREQVQALVTVSQSADAYQPDQSHLVFFAHNCLPMRYAFQGVEPYAQAAGVTVRLEPDTAAYPVVYTSAEALPDRSLTMTSRVGSGGAIGIPSERNLTLVGFRNGREFARTVFNAPMGGLGIVHLVPAARR